MAKRTRPRARVRPRRHFLTRRPLDLKAAIAEVSGPGRGAMVTFSGVVRDRERGERISSIAYEAYPRMAEPELAKLVRDVERRWRVRVSLRHRTGRVRPGEAAVVIACAGVHRREAFAAAGSLIDDLKKRVPIWKAGFGKARRGP